MPERLILLHGFTQTGRAWDAVVELVGAERYSPVAPDLRGHGSGSATRPITFAALVEDVLAVGGPRFALAGYSLGGRVALHVALAAPTRISRLVLVSTTAGIDDPAARADRRTADEALADRMERQDIAELASSWGAQPLFADQPDAVRAASHADRLRNDPQGLAASLRAVGTGRMPTLWGRLGDLSTPTDVLAGGNDLKFTAIAHRLAAAMPAARLTIVPNAGHALALEAPRAVATVINAPPVGAGP